MNKHRVAIGLEEPQSKAEIEEQSAIPGMRAAIHGGRFDSALINQCLETAARMGLNGEDTYTLMAYYALIALERTSINLSELLQRS